MSTRRSKQAHRVKHHPVFAVLQCGAGAWLRGLASGDQCRPAGSGSALRPVYSDTTQLNSTSSCRHVHSVNNCHLSMNVVTQLTQFVGRDVINKNTTDLAVRCSTGSVEIS